jgi:glutamine synthetase
MDVDLFDLPRSEVSKIKQVPCSLDKALDALDEDNQYLMEGGVFTKEVIDTWLDYKRIKEWDAIRLRPHPYEFFLYFDA